MVYLRLLRIGQWTKNLLVFAALLFTASFGSGDAVVRSLVAFLAMALLSSATYVFNDILDAPNDRLHPTKRSRPVASGMAKPAIAAALGCVCAVASLALCFWLGVDSLAVIAVYIALQVAYNVGVKRVPVADVFVVSLGFVLRAALGAVAIHVAISAWLLFCTLAWALMISLGKRRNEFILMGDDREKSRAGLSGYSRQSLDALLIMSACCSALFYGIYSIESKTARAHPALTLTALFVFYGVARYLFLVFTKDEGGEPDLLLVRDMHILLSVVLFVASAYLAMKGVPIPFLEGAAK